MTTNRVVILKNKPIYSFLKRLGDMNWGLSSGHTKVKK